MLKLILVRHGQTQANLNHMLQGSSDGALTPVGIQQAEKLAFHLKDYPIDQILSSDLQRASDTAAAIAKYHNLSVKTTPLLREWNGGDLEGQPAEVFHQLLRTLKQSNTPLTTYRPTGGETLLEVHQRAEEFLNEIIHSCQEKTTLVCSHGDFLRMTLSIILNQDADLAETSIFFENGSYSIFEFNEDRWTTIALNQVPPS